MRITITGASGLIGSKLTAALTQRGDEVTKVSLRHGAPDPADLAGRDAIVHLAGENVAQRWNDKTRSAIRESRERGTHQLVEAIASADPRPRALISSSAVGYYGPHGDERLDESTPPGHDFLAEVCVAWEREADQAAELGLRVVKIRTGVVLDPDGGALSKMLLPFKLGGGGPVAGGKQYMPWIHVDDVVGMYLRAIDDPAWTGAFNATAPEPVTNKTFSKALGRALHRPAVAPIPGAAIRLLYGDMAEIVTKGQRVVPKRALELGYTYQHADLDEALEAAVG
ncbi:TIGR01777 family oxidoreductase [Solirubrobacter soli]|uniref:TIGR01777 family oxidoreductase n=1 Tax=Solirubrobacter soli TaxID=363832 RepID=UPI0004122C17|nr:TIGR01777 family oxidoreductase [Solirubrobacter soli]